MKKGSCLFVLLLVLAACDENKSLSQKTGSTIGRSAVDFVAGLGEGIDKRMVVKLDVDPALAAKGLSTTMGKSRGVGSKDASVYIVAGKPFKGTLMVRAMDEAAVEIGRSQVEVEFAADEARYVTFSFNEEMDSQLVRSYLLSLR
ncbi:MAG: hypothetical protein FWC28_07340 [Proteobacteria bacterium]|nr:hypothetical protein [Pseudomonadota bacterium]